jgi:arsenate reductase
MQRLRILFLCTGNSCRSQMAEGWTRHLHRNTIDTYSAGLDLKPLNPDAVKVMAEAGVNISNHAPKHVDSLGDQQFDYVITVCGHANEICPTFAGKARVIHVPFDDPPELAKTAASRGEALQHYRRVRDEIRRFVEGLPGSLEQSDQQKTS